MRSLTSTLVLAAAVGLSAASVAHAQRPVAPRRPAPAPNAPAAQPAPGPDGAAVGMGRGGPGGARFGGPGGSPAARLLGLRQQLELTDDQVKKLEALQAAPRPKSSQADRMRAQADLMDAMQGDGNLTAARAALDKMHKVRTDEAIARLKAQQDARAVLTPAQKTKLDNFRQAFGRRMRQDRPGGRQGFGRGQAFGPGGRNRMGPPGQMGGPQFGRQGPPQGFRQGPPMGQGKGPGMMPMGPRGRRGGDTLPDSAGR